MSRNHLVALAAVPLAISISALASSSAVTAHAPPDTVTVSLEPQAGSTNVSVSDGAVTLGSDPAAAGSTGIRQRSGYANLAPVQFDTPVQAVTVGYSATTPASTTASVDVRAEVDGTWTEWTTAQAGAATNLLASTPTVQVRVLLTARGSASPDVSDIKVAPAVSTGGSLDVMADPVPATVYATREGLVGGTTANGHVIVEHDHFVALPSRRGLSDNNDGTYSVEVCANGRCIFEPVWDVGPWNIQDDYWNPSDVREMWQDLGQGVPEAQAAYYYGYNGGQDQFGRTVANPAGIDLADGAFWDGLQLSDNSWVEVRYLWTGDWATGTVDASVLNVRSGPDTSSSIVGMAGNHARVPVFCQTVGETISGTQGTTNLWLQVHDGMYVSKAYVAAGDAPAC